ncbi:MAG: SBBP repeat-containing protein, partial [candidate division Zixibacteria bacterium]
VTGSTPSLDFPTENPYDGSLGGNFDAFVTKLSPTGNSLVYSTYLGGANDDLGHGIAVDASGNAYVTGDTESSDFPTEIPYDGSLGGRLDAFVTKLSRASNSLVYSTYLGGGSYDGGEGIDVDGSGNAYVTGSTSSLDFPTENPYGGSYNGSSDAFVTKFGPEESGCDYIIGDFNGSGSFNISDIIDGFSKLKIGSPEADLICECPSGSGNEWAIAIDVNNSCAFNISDIIDGFSKLKTGSPELEPCADCPPPGWEPAPRDNEEKPIVIPRFESRLIKYKGETTD